MCCKRCKDRLCGKSSSTAPIYIVEESQNQGAGFQFEEGDEVYNDSGEELDENQSDSKIVRLINNKGDDSYNQPSLNFDESTPYSRKEKDD